jgi:hypothetical protein
MKVLGALIQVVVTVYVVVATMAVPYNWQYAKKHGIGHADGARARPEMASNG